MHRHRRFRTARNLFTAAAFALLATVATAPADPASKHSSPDPATGALTLEVSPVARFLRSLVPVAVEGERRDALGRLLPGRVQDPYDRELSDSFTRHETTRAVVPANAPARPRLVFNEDDASSTRPVAAAPAAAYDFSPPIVAPASASSYSYARFAADMLAAPARTRLADEATGSWLGEPAAPARSETAASIPAAPGFGFPIVSASGFAVGSVPATASRANPLPEGINANSVVYGFGNNFYGQQGSTTANSVNTGITSPTQITSVGSGVSAVTAGGAFGMYLRGGNLYTAGNNFYGQLGNATNLGSSTAPNPTPTQVSGLTSGATTLIAGGANFALAVANNTLYAWGFNMSGQTGSNAYTGTATANYTPLAVSGMPSGTITAISGGGSHTLALVGGKVYAFGLNNNGQLGNTTNNGSGGTANPTANPTPVLVGTVPSGVTAIAAGASHSLALVGGNVYAWGYNYYGQLGNTTNNTLGAGQTNTANPTPTVVNGLPSGKVTSIAAGANFSLALANGNVYSWGFNGTGQLGNGTTSDTTVANPTPYEVQFGGTNLSGIIALTAAASASYALASDGSLYVWGTNTNGQLGLGNNTTPYTTPQHILPPTGQYYQAIGTGENSAFALAIVGDSPVPEPATWAGGVLLLAAAGLTLRRRAANVLSA